MRSIKMLLAMLVVGLLVCGSAAVALAQTGGSSPAKGYTGPTPFGPGEYWRSNDTSARGWISADQSGKTLETNMGYSGPTPFGPGEYWRPNNPAQRSWIAEDDRTGKPLATNMGYNGSTPFGPGEYWRPNNPAQKGWIHLAD
jgi:hypothetical protein